jgi:hypothetical protein
MTVLGQHQSAESREQFRSKNLPVIVNAFELIPWIYHITHTREIEKVSLPGLSVNHVTVEMLDLVAEAELTKPAGVPSSDNALELVRKSNKATTLWYDTCAFTLDAIQSGSSVVRRAGP